MAVTDYVLYKDNGEGLTSMASLVLLIQIMFKPIHRHHYHHHLHHLNPYCQVVRLYVMMRNLVR